MKTSLNSASRFPRARTWLASLALAAISTSLATAQLTYDFNTPGQLNDNFGYNVPSSPPSMTNAGTQSPTGGLTNSGWVTNSVKAPAWGFEVADQAFSGATNITLSIYFQWQSHDILASSYQGLFLGVGRSSDTNAFSPVGGSSGTNLGPPSGQLLHMGIATVPNTANGVRFYTASIIDGYNVNATPSGTATLTDGNWYYLQVDFSLLGTGDGYNAVAKLYDSSNTGIIGSLLLSNTSGNITNVNLLGGDIQAYFGMRAPTYGGVKGVDDFYISTIPEPSTLILCLIGLLGVLGYRKRKQA